MLQTCAAQFVRGMENAEITLETFKHHFLGANLHDDGYVTALVAFEQHEPKLSADVLWRRIAPL